ncbi:MAG: efflux transporter outer membrane subunit [Methylovirgula sp.]
MTIKEHRFAISAFMAKSAFISRCSGILTVAFSLSGCIPTAIVPNPALDVPAGYRSGGTGAEAPTPKADWWTAFRSSELDHVMESTVTANFDVAAAVARIIQADAAARVVGATLLPTLSAGDSVTKSYSSSLSSGSSGSGSRTIYSSLFNASYVVDLWGKNRSAFEASIATANFRRFDRDTVILTSISSAAETYFAVLGARERITYARQDITDATRILKLIQDRAKFGTATALSVAQQEALVDNLIASIPPLQEIADQNVAALALLLGEPPQRLTIKTTSLANLHMPAIAPGLPSQLLLQRPDVQSAEAQLISAHANLVSARAAFFPQIQLTGDGGFESLALKTLFTPQAGLYSVAASLTQPIFDGGAIAGAFDQQKGVQDELLADYRKSVVSAFTDVEKGLIAVKQTALEEAALQKSLIASRKAYDLAEQQLRAGTIDYVTLLQTEQTLFTTLDSLSQARLAHFQAAVTLYQALGGGIPWRRPNDS